MRLKVLSSSSMGNGYIIFNDKECLVIECGVPLSLLGFNVNLSTIVGCIVSHEHKDHSEYFFDYVSNFIPVYSSKGTNDVLKSRINNERELKNYSNMFFELKEYSKMSIGNFIVLSFPLIHDAIQPFGFAVFHKEIGSLVFITDTGSIPVLFSGVNHLVIESNHDNNTIKERALKGCISSSLLSRIKSTHLSFENAMSYAKDVFSESLKNIVFIHLSDRNSNAKYMLDVAKKEFPSVNVVVSDSREKNEINLVL